MHRELSSRMDVLLSPEIDIRLYYVMIIVICLSDYHSILVVQWSLLYVSIFYLTQGVSKSSMMSYLLHFQSPYLQMFGIEVVATASFFSRHLVREAHGKSK